MKTLLTFFLLCGSFGILAQTSVIGLKSRHGNLADLPKSTDAFGEFIPAPIYDSLVKINNSCVIQIGKDNGMGVPFRDTVCEHWYYERVGYDFQKIQEYHGDNVTLIGFNDDNGVKQNKDGHFSKKRHQKQSSKWIFVFFVLSGFGVFFVRPKRLWIR